MQKSLAKLSIFCENAKGFDLFCWFLLINQEKLRKIYEDSRQDLHQHRVWKEILRNLAEKE